MQHTRHIHANTTRHDDPRDDWQPIGSFVRELVAKQDAKQRQRTRDLEEFCGMDPDGDDDRFIATFTRFGG
jgi:hypothetical protein